MAISNNDYFVVSFSERGHIIRVVLSRAISHDHESKQVENS